jgi:hypothetical protein
MSRARLARPATIGSASSATAARKTRAVLRTQAHIRGPAQLVRWQGLGLGFRGFAHFSRGARKKFSLRRRVHRFLSELGQSKHRSLATQAMFAQPLALLLCDRLRDVTARKHARSSILASARNRIGWTARFQKKRDRVRGQSVNFDPQPRTRRRNRKDPRIARLAVARSADRPQL